MRHFRLLLIALVFVLHSAAVMASSVKICCMDAHCPVAECVTMGCLADPLPPAAVPVTQHTSASSMRTQVMPLSSAHLASHVEDIWTPPD